MIANVHQEGLPFFYCEIDLRLFKILQNGKESVTPYSLGLTGWYHSVLSQRFWKCFDDSKCIWCGDSNRLQL